MAASPEAFEAPTLGRAWDQFLRNIGALAAVTLVTMVFAVLAIIVYGVVNVGVTILAGQDQASLAALIASLLAEVGRLPFTIFASLTGVLIAAIPAVYFATGEVVTIKGAFDLLLARPWRYLLAGLLFAVVSGVGTMLCLLPGIAVGLTYPIYVNRIFTSDEPIFDAFTGSFQALYGHEKSWTFVGIEVLLFLVVLVVSVCTCGLASLVAVPIASFYIQNSAYRLGLLS